MSDERADFPTLGNRFLIRSDRTEGRFALIEHTIAPRSLGAPTHTHENEDEYSFVISGRMGAMVGDEVHDLSPGEFVEKPRRVAHAFWNAGEEEAKLLEVISPGGFEQYFADMAPLLNTGGPPDAEAVQKVQQRYGLSMDRRSIEELSERFGLLPPGPPPPG